MWFVTVNQNPGRIRIDRQVEKYNQPFRVTAHDGKTEKMNPKGHFYFGTTVDAGQRKLLYDGDDRL